MIYLYVYNTISFHKIMVDSVSLSYLNTLRPRQNGRHFADAIFKCILLNENVWILNKILLKFVPKGPINNIPSLVQIMAWRRPGDKPLSEPMMVSSLTHICVTRPQWVNKYFIIWISVVYFTQEANPRLAKLPLKLNGSLAKNGLTRLVK